MRPLDSETARCYGPVPGFASTRGLGRYQLVYGELADHGQDGLDMAVGVERVIRRAWPAGTKDSPLRERRIRSIT